MTAAINLCDLDELRADPLLIAIMLGDFISVSSPIVKVDHSHMDTGAVVIDGNAASDETRVSAILDLLTKSIGPRKLGRRIRCYVQGSRGGWKEYR